MSIACPYCKAALNPKGLKPGRFQPKCPKCGKVFTLLVPEDSSKTISVHPLAAEKPEASAKAIPKPRRKLTVDEHAALLLEGKNPADYGDAPDASEASTQPQTDPSADLGATGDFTEAQPSAPPKSAATLSETVVRQPDVDPSATGDFTEANESRERAQSSQITDGTDDFHEKRTRLDPDEKFARKPKDEASEERVLGTDAPPRLGGYEVLKVLGRGGMGAVLLGRQISLDRKVAIKVMHPHIAKNPSFVARFTREAYAAAQLTHHNVIQIYDISEDKGHHFFSMEFVQGHSLMELVKREGKLTPEVAVGYVLQAARGLRYGHNQGMVHRDIKPDNLMLNSEGIVKVADLGLVKLGNTELAGRNSELKTQHEEAEESSFASSPTHHGSSLTRAGAVMGTPAYMSPEQSTDSAAVDARADIYSLGCTLYVLITGKPPFDGKTALEIISKHQTEPIVPPEVVVKRVPKALSAILLKMLAKKAADRYQSMDEVIAALEGFLGLEHSGPFSPKEEQADLLEKCAHQFQFHSKSGLKRSLALGFFAVYLLGIVVSAFGGMAALAGGLFGLAIMTPLAYFVVHGVLTGNVVFTRLRGAAFSMRLFDWLFWLCVAALFLITLFLFGLLWSWLGFAIVAVGLAFALWFLTDRAAAKAQEVPLDEARGLLKSLRLQGLEEDAVRRFVCKFGGQHWERLFESLFGYEAMIAARASRKGDTGETWKKFGTWRDPIVQWADARMEAKRLAKERAYLQKVEAKALVAEGVNQSDAKARAEEMAAQMVDQAEEAKKARKEGKEVSVKQMVAAARDRRPQPGMTIAGKKHRDLWFKDFINNWFGRRLRFAVGAFVFAVGLLWLYQNDLLQGNKAFTAIAEGNIESAQQAATETSKATTKPLALPGGIIPNELKSSFNTWALPLTGLLVLINSICYFGWKSTLPTLAGAAVGIFGPLFGIPALNPLTAQQLSFIIGAILILVVAWILRQ